MFTWLRFIDCKITYIEQKIPQMRDFLFVSEFSYHHHLSTSSSEEAAGEVPASGA